MRTLSRFLILLGLTAAAYPALSSTLSPAAAQEAAKPPAAPVLAAFGAGEGPRDDGGTIRLLDGAKTRSQANSAAFAVATPGAHESVSLRCKLRVLEGGDGGWFAFLPTSQFGARGPAPHVPLASEPNLRGAFAVGIDVHNPKNTEPFSEWGNYQDRPQREVSLHWDGREIVKRVAPAEFRGDFADCEILLEHVTGGADVTVKLAGAAVYERYFLPGVMPYESRLAIGAGTRRDVSTEFDVKDVVFDATRPAARRRAPKHVELFNHVLTDNSKTEFTTTADLPPAEFAFGRVTLTLEIHDAGAAWDEWDRCGEISVIDAEGRKFGILPFITSYRTPCRWDVDVTHFRPILAGKTKIEIAAGTNFYKNRGYMMSASLDFHHGDAAAEPFRVVPLWHGTAHYRSDENHFSDFFKPQRVEIPEGAALARIFTTTTGHSQIGEFVPSKRAILVGAAAAEPSSPAPEARRYENILWKDDCYLNPNRPQFGTWKFSRAGWAPGDIVHPWILDVTADVVPGKAAEFRYEPSRYDFTGLLGEGEAPPKAEDIAQASHNIRSFLILYRKPGTTLPAPVLQVMETVGGGPAAKAGIKAGDYIASYDGAPVDSSAELRAAVEAATAAKKETCTVVVWRGTERLTFDLPAGRLGVQLSER